MFIDKKSHFQFQSFRLKQAGPKFDQAQALQTMQLR